MIILYTFNFLVTI